MSEFTQNGTQPYDQLVEKWNPVLNHDSFDKIGDSYKKKVTAVLLENQEIAMKQQYLAEAPTNSMGGGFSVTQAANQAGSIAGYDPVLISLIRRSMPNLMAYDICGVQPMSAPTGLIFAMKSKYDSQGSSQEALFQEAFAKFSGKGGTTAGAAENAGSGVTFVGDTPGVTLTAGEFARAAVFGTGFQGISAANAEGLGGAGGSFNQMAFSIERVAVEARTRALKAEYSTELAQDLKAVHGLDAETELANILSTEILTEINREIIRNVYFNAEIGCTQTDLAGAGAADGPVSGMYDLAVDSDGRWSAERFRGLMFQIERECNQIAKETRRGKGNFIIVSSDVASALAMGGFLNISPALNQQLDVDDTGNTFAGLLNGKIRVYVDPYVATGQNHVCVGYKGTSPYDAGLFYCPYVPLQMVRAVGENTFQPKIGFKTRYGVVSNPFANSTDILTAGGNQYYRLFVVKNLHGNGS
jgi:hypothetical protein